MIYVHEHELHDYLSRGFVMSQLSIIPSLEPIPSDSSRLNEIRSLVRCVIRESVLSHEPKKTVLDVDLDSFNEAVEFDNNKTFIPLPNVAQRAQEALNAVSRNDLTQSGTNQGSGKSKAKELASKQTQSFDMMRRIKSFFETNQEAYNAEKAAGKDINSSGLIQSWELFGGDSGRDWVKQELGSLNQSNLNTKKNLRKAGGAGENKGMGTFDTKIMSTNNHRIHR